MILAGRITVNRMPAEVGQKVGPGDEVRINGDLVKVRFTEPRPRVLIYHKPAGELVTRDDPEGRPTVFEKLPSIGHGKWINIGRLDYNTEGLLLFTNSGDLANRMMHPRFEVEREYAVRVMGRLDDSQLERLTTGIDLDDGPARCDRVDDAGGDEDGANHWYKVVLREGRNREVRRLFEALGIMVSRLIRTRYGPVGMPTVLKRGDLLELEANDVAAVVTAAGLRSGTMQDGGTRPDAGKGGRPRGPGGRPGQSSWPQGPGRGSRNPQQGSASRTDEPRNAPRAHEPGTGPRRGEPGDAGRRQPAGNGPRRHPAGHGPRREQAGNAPREPAVPEAMRGDEQGDFLPRHELRTANPDHADDAQRDFEPGNGPRDFEPGNGPREFEPGNGPRDFEPGNGPREFEPGNGPREFAPGVVPPLHEPGNGPAPQRPANGPRKHGSGGPRGQAGGGGRPHNGPGGKPRFGKGPRLGARPGGPRRDSAPGAPRAEPAQRDGRPDYEERQPLSNANAFPFPTPRGGAGGEGARSRPGGPSNPRSQGYGGRPPGQGPRPHGQARRTDGSGSDRDGNRDPGGGPRGPGQGPRGPGAGPRGPGQPGRGAGPGNRAGGPGERGPGKGGRPAGKGKRPHGGPGRPQGFRTQNDAARPVVDRRVQQVKAPVEPRMPSIKRLRRPLRLPVGAGGAPEAAPVAPVPRSEDES